MNYQHVRDMILSTNLKWNDWVSLIPALSLLDMTPQDPEWHAEGDVGLHTRMVLDSLISTNTYKNSDEDTQFVLFTAALLHDIAKPSCTVHEDNGHITSAGHSRRGAVDARILLWKGDTPFNLRERICGIIAAHQMPFHAIKGDRSGHSPEFIVHKLSQSIRLEDLATIAEADARGRICKDNQETLDNIELFRELAKDEGCYTSAKKFPDEHTRLSYFRSEGKIPHQYAFHQPEGGSTVTVLSGLPASGKDTWVHENGNDLPVISFDDARAELGLKHGKNSGAAVHLSVDRAKGFLRKGQDFIWNATHLSKQMRDKTIDLLLAYNATVRIVYLEQPEKVIKSRNNKRDTTLSNTGIDSMLFNWDIPLITEAHKVAYETHHQKRDFATIHDINIWNPLQGGSS